MQVSKPQLLEAARSVALPETKAEELWQALQNPALDPTRSRFDLAHLAYYFGALLIIGAMGWFMSNCWEGLGGAGLLVVAICYAVCFVIGGRRSWEKPEYRVPGGLLITAAVCMVPLAIYGLERWTGYWPAGDPGAYRNFHPHINGSWILMELGTIVAGLVALRFWRFPFLTAPIAYSLWYLSMDLVALVYGHGELGWEEKKLVSVCFGAALLFGSYGVDLRSKRGDFSFWGYLFGLMIFWGALTSMDSDSELGKLAYCLINLGLLFLSLALRRKAFLIFGAVGVSIYIGHLAHRVFADTPLFPAVLCALGVGIMVLGLKYQKNRKRLEGLFRDRVLQHIRNFIPPRVFQDAD